jgi:hypothetical protein
VKQKRTILKQAAIVHFTALCQYFISLNQSQIVISKKKKQFANNNQLFFKQELQ